MIVSAALVAQGGKGHLAASLDRPNPRPPDATCNLESERTRAEGERMSSRLRLVGGPPGGGPRRWRLFGDFSFCGPVATKPGQNGPKPAGPRSGTGSSSTILFIMAAIKRPLFNPEMVNKGLARSAGALVFGPTGTAGLNVHVLRFWEHIVVLV